MEDLKLKLEERGVELAQKARAAIGRKASELWWTFLVRGGLVLLFWPGTGVVALGWALAILAFAVALVMFFLASRFRRVDQLLASKQE